MTPGNIRPMAHRDAGAVICRAALYSVSGVCRCPRCAPEPSPVSSDLAKLLDRPAAAPTPTPLPTGGGLFDQERDT